MRPEQAKIRMARPGRQWMGKGDFTSYIIANRETMLYETAERKQTLGSTRPLTEMSTRNLPVGKRRPLRGADNLTAICEPIV
jgi:hypothetical protein